MFVWLSVANSILYWFVGCYSCWLGCCLRVCLAVHGECDIVLVFAVVLWLGGCLLDCLTVCGECNIVLVSAGLSWLLPGRLLACLFGCLERMQYCMVFIYVLWLFAVLVLVGLYSYWLGCCLRVRLAVHGECDIV